ncbi:hypothetical protein CLV32_3010 [Pedobacter duraquae]|uniref:Uncharacterized protein n=1 Tax=Pedobacter duraquae TaxID=425511 RepID=A0A4R6IIT2_9SPHI|nr:hypothetical protein CLV32_3010 [Pedobacter duraquae]
MTQRKLLIVIGLTAFFAGASAYIFNHFNPWIGIILGISTAITSITYLQNQFKKNEK